jgi:RNA polymerase sporulation-specific sigma factor
MQKMVLENMRLAYKIAWNFHGSGIEQEELNDIALFGLCKAAASFDESKGFKFSSFAVPVIQNEILMELRRIRYFKDSISLDAENPFFTDDGDTYTLLDQFPIEEKGYEWVNNSDLIPSLIGGSNLSNKEQSAVMLVVINGVNQSAAGERLGISQPQVGRLVKSGVNKIRKEYWEGERKVCKLN